MIEIVEEVEKNKEKFKKFMEGSCYLSINRGKYCRETIRIYREFSTLHGFLNDLLVEPPKISCYKWLSVNMYVYIYRGDRKIDGKRYFEKTILSTNMMQNTKNFIDNTILPSIDKAFEFAGENIALGKVEKTKISIGLKFFSCEELAEEIIDFYISETYEIENAF
jgi:hypothetical protein